MLLAMTLRTEHDQVVEFIAAETAPPSHVMDLQFHGGTAHLTAPTVAL
jgi:hypothetical protein